MRRVTGLLSLLALAIVLVACGGEGDDEPTVAPTVPDVPTEAPTATMPPASTASPAASSPMADASPVVSPSGTPVATPIIVPPATPMASPVASPHDDGAVASPVAPVVVATPMERTSWELEGTVLLPGSSNEHYVIGDDGCVGLGEYAGVAAGQQVVVRDAAGTILGLASLADGGSASECIWTFAVEVPVSDFYTVSLPLMYERAYSNTDLAVMDGRIQITLP